MVRLNEHEFNSTDADAECRRCSLKYREADAWKTRCRGEPRKATPEPEQNAGTGFRGTFG